MANHPSAIKRARQNEDRRERNKTAKTRVKNVIKSVHTAAGSDMDPEALAKQLNEAKSIIAKSAKKAAIHRRAASRKISRLERRVNAVKK
ncbi:MAG: 30S ribosomal protein S20 [Deltaproteobacteria bacterium]|nr:30S ribosomal protein S20 [Deltaproteobacteria bacterium]MBW1956481.1 30S ribosomal protein S20 [Deltaproteobacteria bacterium]